MHEHAWLVVLEGEVSVGDAEGNTVSGGPGLIVRFDPGERHEVRAATDARLLLLLAPWPGDGHPGTMSLDEKSQAREKARERSAPQR